MRAEESGAGRGKSLKAERNLFVGRAVVEKRGVRALGGRAEK